jgi:hypothetical protein
LRKSFAARNQRSENREENIAALDAAWGHVAFAKNQTE